MRDEETNDNTVVPERFIIISSTAWNQASGGVIGAIILGIYLNTSVSEVHYN